MKKKFLIITCVLAFLLSLGIFFPANAVNAKEQAETAGEETTDSDTAKMNILMYTKDKLTAMSGPDTTYDAVTELAAESPVVVTGKTANNWYQFYYEGTVAYIQGDKLKEPPVDESLVQEMEAHAQNDVVEIESFVRQQKEAARAKVWGIIIAVLIVAIFALGIITTLRAGKTADGENMKNGDDEDNPIGEIKGRKDRDGKDSGKKTAYKEIVGESIVKDTVKPAEIRKPIYKKPIEREIKVLDLDDEDDEVK